MTRTTTQHRDVIERMWADGASQHEIATAIGRSTQALGTIMGRLRAGGADLPYRRSFRAPVHEHLNQPISDEQRCSLCLIVKPLEAFPAGLNANGVNSHCRACRDDQTRARRLAHPEKRQAHEAVRLAVASGRLVRPDACSHCFAGGTIEGHHPDYAKPLDVVWLCVSCHQQHHASQARRGSAARSDIARSSAIPLGQSLPASTSTASARLAGGPLLTEAQR